MKARAGSQRNVNFAFSGACHRSHDRGLNSRRVVEDVLEQAGNRITFVCVAMLASIASPGCLHGPTNENTAQSSSLSSANRVDSDHGDDAYFNETPSAVESIYMFA